MIYTMGLDIGSSACKSIILADGKEIVGKSLIPVGTGTSGPMRAFDGVLKDAGLTIDDISYLLTTGYGRNTFERADGQMSELSCHAKGACYLFPDVQTVIDIGGQDVKVIQISNGAMVNFQMNDKCAAGTGRFLDVMSRILEVDVSDLDKLAAQSTEQISISSTCTVFAESEVISQLAKGVHKADIANGVHWAITARVVGLARRIGIRDRVVMTGGVAQNKGVVHALSQQLKHEVSTSDLSQYVGALGAAIYAYAKVQTQAQN
ncbi:acyl-CoA dehydratase activase [Kallipyga massiliensis]|uniref:acyl-CoA dehydratase activase n=1 Tax=Kallipyga massiliensis TaxID=1472764 RepID=UPI0026EEE5A6|nr:acyl-CoA dehydratase activase [Kallipyga massiliensis]